MSKFSEFDAAFMLFAAKLGVAISQWQVVEHILCEFMCDLLETKDRRNAAIVFHSVVAFNGKLDIIDELIKLRVTDKPTLKEWTKLLVDIKAAATKRNQMVHWSYAGDMASTPGPLPYEFRAMPASSDFRAKMSGKSISIPDMEAHTKTFMKLHGLIFAFQKKLLAL